MATRNSARATNGASKSPIPPVGVSPTIAVGRGQDIRARIEGAAVFCKLLKDISAVPELLRAGYKRSDDDSTIRDYSTAEELVEECFAKICGERSFVKDERMYGFMNALTVELKDHVEGSYNPDMTPREIIAEFDESYGNTPVAADDDEPASSDSDAVDITVPAKYATMARRATYEVEALLFSLVQAVDAQSNVHIESLARSTAVRLLQLNAVLIGALDHEGWPIEEVRQELYGATRTPTPDRS